LDKNQLDSFSNITNENIMGWPITMLSMVDNCFEKIPKEFGYLDKLQKLVLDGNKIKVLEAKILPMSVKVLSIRRNKLVECDEFTYFPLTELYLDDNELKKLPVSIDQLRQLQILSVSNNQLASVPGL